MNNYIELLPVMTEKTYSLSEQRVYVFKVKNNINKQTIKQAVEAQFNVKVMTVNIVNLVGKSKRVISISGKRVRNQNGRTSASSKAYVTLAINNSLPFFDAVKESEEEEKATQEKFEQAIDKEEQKKSSKPKKRRFIATKKEETK